MEDDDEYEITYDEVNVDRLLQRASAAVDRQVTTRSDQPGVLAGLPAHSRRRGRPSWETASLLISCADGCQATDRKSVV